MVQSLAGAVASGEVLARAYLADRPQVASCRMALVVELVPSPGALPSPARVPCQAPTHLCPPGQPWPVLFRTEPEVDWEADQELLVKAAASVVPLASQAYLEDHLALAASYRMRRMGLVAPAALAPVAAQPASAWVPEALPSLARARVPARPAPAHLRFS